MFPVNLILILLIRKFSWDIWWENTPQFPLNIFLNVQNINKDRFELFSIICQLFAWRSRDCALLEVPSSSPNQRNSQIVHEDMIDIYFSSRRLTLGRHHPISSSWDIGATDLGSHMLTRGPISCFLKPSVLWDTPHRLDGPSLPLPR